VAPAIGGSNTGRGPVDPTLHVTVGGRLRPGARRRDVTKGFPGGCMRSTSHTGAGLAPCTSRKCRARENPFEKVKVRDRILGGTLVSKVPAAISAITSRGTVTCNGRTLHIPLHVTAGHPLPVTGTRRRQRLRRGLRCPLSGAKRTWTAVWMRSSTPLLTDAVEKVLVSAGEP
jgi:hypothetical protein